MSFRRASTAQVTSTDPGVPVRFTRWWRGYQQGQVARFPVRMAEALRAKGFAIPYKPTAEEKADDEFRFRVQKEGREEWARQCAMAAAGQLQPVSPNTTA